LPQLDGKTQKVDFFSSYPFSCCWFFF
jgi:hypothetical protein